MTMNFWVAPKFCLCLILAAILFGCGGVKKGSGDVSAASTASLSSAMEYYLFGLRQLKARNINGATETLGEMEIKYPLNLETGELYAKLIKGYYEAGQLDRVIETADRFTNMFPSHKNVGNAHYLAAMADYDRGRKNISMDVNSSDPSYAKTALARFHVFLDCCGNTEHAYDVKQYIYHLESMISLYELRYMEWDYDAGRIDAAAQRGISLMLTYPDSVASKRAAIMLSSNIFDEFRAGIEEATAIKLPVAVAEELPVTEQKKELGGYAVYLVRSSHPEALKEKVAAMGLANEVDYYKKIEAGSDEYYFAAYGNFISRDEAQLAQLELSVRINKPDLWVRKLENSEYVENVDLEKAIVLPEPVAASVVTPVNAEVVDAAPLVMAAPVEKMVSPSPQPESEPVAVEKFYAIQMMSLSKKDQLKKAVASMGLTDDVALYSHIVKGKTYFIALYGKYPDWAAGKAGLAELGQRTGKTGYWLRKVDSSKLEALEKAVVSPEPVVESVVTPVNAGVVDAVPLVVVAPVEKMMSPSPSPSPSPQSEPVAVEKYYAIKMMSLSKLDQLKEAVATIGLTDGVALYSHIVKGKTYYIALYGKYPDWSSGKAGLAELEQRTGKTGYWLYKVDSSKLEAID